MNASLNRRFIPKRVATVLLLFASTFSESCEQESSPPGDTPKAANDEHANPPGSDSANLLERARKGDIVAQYELATDYLWADGSYPESIEEGMRWYRAAAEAGHAQAAFELGTIYDLGWHGDLTDEERAQYRIVGRSEPNADEAFKWYQASARLGHEAAARITDRLARANQNDVDAQYTVGQWYEWGTDLPSSSERALEWFQKASHLGCGRASFEIAMINDIGKHGTVPPIDREEEAIRWYRVAAEQGHYYAMFMLATKYEAGEEIPKNDAEATRWFLAAAQQGDDSAQFALGCKLLRTNGRENEMREATTQGINWLTRAAKQGRSDAQLELAYCYAGKLWVEENLVLAYSWANIAAQTSDTARKLREHLGWKLSKEQIDEAQRMSSAFTPAREIDDSKLPVCQRPP